ncbi:MAG TPA: polysaccharide deacetylase family protein [Candidatus Saccharimonadales bacterium]|nr:polysaccharide deacetylase family protein [Candidatus Saccharimonadales bacterium]
MLVSIMVGNSLERFIENMWSLKNIASLGVVMTFTLINFVSPSHVFAAVQSPRPVAKVSFTFDDGLTSALTQAAPALSAYGLTGTDYIITNCVGMVTSPNGCRANTDASYMSWSQIGQLQNTYGWEIGSHTADHYCLASTGDGDDCQTYQLTPAEVEKELSQSKADLVAHGINAVDMSTPYGDYNNQSLALIAKYYQSQRGFADLGDNSWPYSDYFLHVMQVQGRVSVSQVEQAIDQAITANDWLVLVMHDIKPKASRKNDDYQWSTSKLRQVAAYVKAKQNASLIQSTTINDGLVKSDIDLLPNSSFNDGIADGWRTDAPDNVTADSGNNGSYPDPSKAIMFTSGNSAVHLFSPRIPVDANTTYMLKNFVNVVSNSGGELAFYVDEYDANGNWISGQYLKAERSAFVEELNFTYRPTSPSVRQASLQVIVTGGSGIKAYLDNCQWFPLQTSTPPVQTNLVANGTFDNGIADGWSTDDPANITSDNLGNGSPSNPTNSIRLRSSIENTHLFSPLVSVSPTSAYSLDSYLDLRQISGSNSEVAYYIDEYDANGNWISGQYKTGIHTLGAGRVNLQYTPSSAGVSKASLQIIVVGSSNILAYIDDIHWYKN